MENTKLTKGQILYSVEKRKLGNTTMRSVSVYQVVIVEVAEDKSYFIASWNNNQPRKYYSVPSTWKTKKPVLVNNRITSRLATKEEINDQISNGTGTLVEGSLYFTLKAKVD